MVGARPEPEGINPEKIESPNTRGPRMDRDKSVRRYFDYLKEINEVHNLAIQRLLSGDNKVLPELAELCEDIGNLYMNFSEDIRRFILSDAEMCEGPREDALSLLLANLPVDRAK
ncbi:MAG: hypothetical protein WCD42_01135 [Rhizomicrobium sp.]